MSITTQDGTQAPPAPLPVAGHARAAVDPGFEQRLIEGTRPIAEHYLAGALHHIFESGVFDGLADREGQRPIADLATSLDLDARRLRGLLLYLANEGVVTVTGEDVALTPKGRRFGEFRPWYTMMIGGYSTTVQQIGDALAAGSPPCGRDGRFVGLGSCEMSRFDGMPIMHTLLERAGVRPREVLDLGCGNGLYLVELCRQLPGVRAWGAEPDPGGYSEAVALVDQEGMGERIGLHNASATEFLLDPPDGCDPDLLVLAYVLQEIVAQEGEEALVTLLRTAVERFPEMSLVVIEVANEIDNPTAMRHGLARNFWNPYYLLHYFTAQRLEKQVFWDSLFEVAGLQVVDLVSTDPAVDSSGLEFGYLLRGRGA